MSSRSIDGAPAAPPVVLTIAGSDSSAGAGLQADLKTFFTHGVYGVSATSCLVAEVPGTVTRIESVDPSMLSEQIRILFEHFPIAAVKTGLLYSAVHVEVVAKALEAAVERNGSAKVPLVIDPVLVASSGDPLLESNAIGRYKQRLFDKATLVTPNLDETAVLIGYRPETIIEMKTAAHDLADAYQTAFLVKGGHLDGDKAIDILAEPGSDKGRSYEADFVNKSFSTHGTGCTYSAAITANLAKGLDLKQAIGEAKVFITRAIANGFRWQPPHEGSDSIDALNHGFSS